MIYNITHEASKGTNSIFFEIDTEAWIMTPIMADTLVRLTPIVCKSEGEFYDGLRDFIKKGWDGIKL